MTPMFHILYTLLCYKKLVNEECRIIKKVENHWTRVIKNRIEIIKNANLDDDQFVFRQNIGITEVIIALIIMRENRLNG